MCFIPNQGWTQECLKRALVDSSFLLYVFLLLLYENSWYFRYSAYHFGSSIFTGSFPPDLSRHHLQLWQHFWSSMTGFNFISSFTSSRCWLCALTSFSGSTTRRCTIPPGKISQHWYINSTSIYASHSGEPLHPSDHPGIDSHNLPDPPPEFQPY